MQKVKDFFISQEGPRPCMIMIDNFLSVCIEQGAQMLLAIKRLLHFSGIYLPRSHYIAREARF